MRCRSSARARSAAAATSAWLGAGVAAGAAAGSAVGATARVCAALGRGAGLRGRRRLGGRGRRGRGRSGGLRRRGLGLGFAGHGRLLGDGRRGAAQEMAGMGDGLGRLRRRLPGGAEAGGGVGADRHGGELERLPVDGAPDRRLAVGLGDLVAADRVADRDVADDAGGDVAPDRLDVGPVGEAHGGAADERLALARDPGPLDDADHVAEVPGAVGVEERRAAVQAAEIDVRLLEREHLVVALAGPGIAPAHRRAGRPDHLDGAPLGVDALRHQPDVGPGLHRQVDLSRD